MCNFLILNSIFSIRAGSGILLPEYPKSIPDISKFSHELMILFLFVHHDMLPFLSNIRFHVKSNLCNKSLFDNLEMVLFYDRTYLIAVKV